MFTCCPQCSTVFRVTANQLRAARGDVRCGNCAHVFNAMESLADELPRLDEGKTATDHTRDTTDAEASLEFDAPEQAWGEIFIEAPQQAGDIALDGELEAITADPDEWRSMLAELGVEPGDIAPEAEDEDAGIALAAASLASDEDDNGLAFPAETGDEALMSDPVYVLSEAGHAEGGRQAFAQGHTAREPKPPQSETDVHPDADEDDDTSGREGPAGCEAPVFAARADIDSDLPPWNEPEPVAEQAPDRRPAAVWGVAIMLLAVTLGAQLFHQARDSLATHPRYGELVRNTYARLDQRLYPEWPLDAFYIRRSEALAGGSSPNALDISAAVEVTGAQPVGLPLVRVTLRDQWANTVGRRVFLPEEYLAGEMSDIVSPGSRIPVALSLADPGTAARGYEVDLCLQRRHSGLECQLIERPYRP